MKKLEMSKITDKTGKKAMISLYLGDEFKLKLIKQDKKYFLFEANIKDKKQINDLIEILKKKKIEHVVIKNLGVVFKEKMDKIEVINKFTSYNIKCFELQNGYNNYIEEPIITSDILLNMISNHKKRLQLDKNKKTIAYMSFKDMKDNENANNYIFKQSENLIKQYAKQNDLEISEIYIDHIPNRLDTKNRNALKKLLKNVKKEEVGQILIPRIEHISRNRAMTLNTVNEICKYGTKVVCCNDNFILG